MPVPARFADPLDGVSFRDAELATAGLTLGALAVFLTLTLTTDAVGLPDGLTMATLWLGTVTTVALPTLVLAHLAYDTIARLRHSTQERGPTNAGTILDTLFRTFELLVSTITLGILGFAVYLTTTQPGGEGSGAIMLVIVFAATATSTLLSILVLTHRLVTGR